MNDAVTMVAHSPIMTLTLNQPEQQNRLNPDLLTILLRRLTEVRQHHGLRAVVLQANGESFSEGTDLAELVAQIDRVAMPTTCSGCCIRLCLRASSCRFR
jgi:2-(1,2-epoxy-1,2-dihydrophenyl)acetyl-CoA isomerase